MYRIHVWSLETDSLVSFMWFEFASDALLYARYLHDAAPYPIDDMGLVIEGPEFIPIQH